ncbi:MAG TPA: isoleucine--tRNA ligase [Methanomassiliicoccales archaeon]|nr:isoleucine--tRNA ligase [Methanomassiliicoccales archaeon]
MIKQVQGSYNPSELEIAVQAYWVETDSYKKTKESRAKGPDFYFVDGPPYTSGYIHLGTAMNKTIKDIMVRFKRMQKFNVTDTPGYDMHGLPIEVKVEKSIGVKNKKEIEEYGIDRFVGTCKSFALDFQKKMNKDFKELGVWFDWDHPYLTINPSYIEAAWWTLKRAFDKGLLEKANRVLPGCPRCETALAEAEINYSDEKDPSIYVKFKLKDEPKVSLLIWTTTPWTLPANLAVAAHPDFDYIKVRYRRIGETDTVIILKGLEEEIKGLGGWEKYEVLEEIQGDDLVGMEYITPFIDEVPYQSTATGKWLHKVIPSKTVEASNTGLVHIAPGHGPEDFDLGKEFGLDPFCPVDEAGLFTQLVGQKYMGMHIKKANPELLKDLEAKDHLFFSGVIEHRFGHCWRCNSPIIFRTTNQWFLRITQVKNQMLEEIEKIRWTPDWAGSSREYDWTMNARDWCISRQRYWGIPIPVWTCSCGEMKVVGMIEELEGAEGYHPDMELHRPWIDQVKLPCPKCGKQMSRIPDVLDVWFDSAVASWAQLGFPRERDAFERLWPAKLIIEAHDQTRGWFYSQLAAGIIAFGRAPYESVLMHGWMLDSHGQPMSKSKGNVVEPGKVIKEYGADALRFYLIKTSAPWEDIPFQMEGVKNARKTLNVFWNVVNFATTYMAIDRFDPKKVTREGVRPHLQQEDIWLISMTEKLKNEVTRQINALELHKAGRAIENYILEDLSRWYVRLIRDRMWNEEGDSGKLAAYRTLYDAIMDTALLMAPICPHLTEEVYRHLGGEKTTVHMMDWPSSDLTRVDERLEKAMSLVQEIVETVTRERQLKNVKLRWPMKRIVIKVENSDTLMALRSMEDILRSQTNVKQVEYVSPGEEWAETVLNVVPNPLAIGKVYRQWASKIAVLLQSRPANLIKESMQRGEYSLGIEGQLVKIEPNMVSFTISLPKDVYATTFSAGELYLDFEITHEIEAEGFSREITRRIQQTRKELKLDVEEFVKVEISAEAKVSEFLKMWKTHIMNEVRSKSMELVPEPHGEMVKKWEIEGETVEIGVTSMNLKDSIKELADIPGITTKIAEALVGAGVRSAADLKLMSDEQIEECTKMNKAEVRKVLHYFDRTHEVNKTVPESLGKPMEKGDIIPYLLRIPRMNELKAEMLYDAGYDSIEKLQNADRDEFKSVPGLGSKTIDEIIKYINDGGFERCTVCPKCKREVTAGDLQCPSCGTSLLVEVEDEADTVTKIQGLQGGYSYLIKDDRSDRSYKLFIDQLNKGSKGFCVTRNYPLKIRSKYEMNDTPIIWLSNVGKEDSLRPKDLEKLSYSLEQFLSKEKGVVLLDGLEYLITNNNFLTVLRFVQSLRDQVAINNSIMLMVLNPSTLDANELTLLEKEVDSNL